MAPVCGVGFGVGELAASGNGSFLTSFFTVVVAVSPAAPPVADERPTTSPRFNLESNGLKSNDIRVSLRLGPSNHPGKILVKNWPLIAVLRTG